MSGVQHLYLFIFYTLLSRAYFFFFLCNHLFYLSRDPLKSCDPQFEKPCSRGIYKYTWAETNTHLVRKLKYTSGKKIYTGKRNTHLEKRETNINLKIQINPDDHRQIHIWGGREREREKYTSGDKETKYTIWRDIEMYIWRDKQIQVIVCLSRLIQVWRVINIHLERERQIHIWRYRQETYTLLEREMHIWRGKPTSRERETHLERQTITHLERNKYTSGASKINTHQQSQIHTWSEKYHLEKRDKYGEKDKYIFDIWRKRQIFGIWRDRQLTVQREINTHLKRQVNTHEQKQISIWRESQKTHLESKTNLHLEIQRNTHPERDEYKFGERQININSDKYTSRGRETNTRQE